jgi:Family of unknown function (DUF5670)
MWTKFVVLVVGWFLGAATSHTFGRFIHVLLLLAVSMVLFRIIQDRKAFS